jgi:DNA-binding MltR family transcriptional regulator
VSNRDALRKLSRKFPALPEIEKVLDALTYNSDLSIAVNGSALIEARLETLISGAFNDKSPQLIGQIFLNKGPLSDFHSKILIAHAMGIISASIAEEIHSVKSIRNAFAHSTSILSFEHELIERELKAFKTMTAINDALISLLSKDDAKAQKVLSNRNWFLIQIRIILYVLENVKTIIDSTEGPHYADDAIKRVQVEQAQASSGKS